MITCPATLLARNHLTSELLRTLSGWLLQANLLAGRATPHPFPLSYRLGTLADGLGWFLGLLSLSPAVSLPRSLNGIRSLVDFGKLVGP